MTEFIGAEKPSLADLEHFGVKGMKWGKRKAPPTRDEIHNARDNVRAAGRAIKAQKKVVRKTGKGQTKLANMRADLLKNPDRITASHMTRGEQAVSIILFTPGAAGVILGGSALTTHLTRKEVERAQAQSKKK